MNWFSGISGIETVKTLLNWHVFKEDLSYEHFATGVAKITLDWIGWWLPWLPMQMTAIFYYSLFMFALSYMEGRPQAYVLFSIKLKLMPNTL